MSKVWTMFSTKGGSGKTTATLVIASELIRLGRSVAIIDADQNQPLATWVGHGRLDRHENLHVLSDTDTSGKTISDTIDHACELAEFVLIDPEGSNNVQAIFALGRTDMAVIPIQSGQQDLEEAMKAFSFVRAVEKQTGRTVPALAIRMRTNAAIEDMVERKIAAQLETEGHPVCKLRLYDKAAYRAIYQEGCLLQDLHEYSSMGGVERARETAALLIPALADAYKTALDLKEPA